MFFLTFFLLLLFFPYFLFPLPSYLPSSPMFFLPSSGSSSFSSSPTFCFFYHPTYRLPLYSSFLPHVLPPSSLLPLLSVSSTFLPTIFPYIPPFFLMFFLLLFFLYYLCFFYLSTHCLPLYSSFLPSLIPFFLLSFLRSPPLHAGCCDLHYSTLGISSIPPEESGKKICAHRVISVVLLS